jgi:N-acetylmuramic acid 6-phosphate etherase
MTQKPKTEQADTQYKGMDEWPNDRVLRSILAAQEDSLKALHAAIPAMAAAADEAALRLKDASKGGRIVYIGAGTPARLAVQDGTELPPTFGWSRLRLAFVIAGTEKALMQAVEGAEDDVQAATAQIAALNLTPNDVCIAISASGSTPFTIEACRAARAAGALTIGISSNQGSNLLTTAEHAVYTDSGPEPVAGSTRMSAGTAQTVALKMISTLVMIRLGHVYDGYMVDVEQTNDKLHRRAELMVCDITGCKADEASAALTAANGNVKLAVLVTTGLSADEGRALLQKSDNNLRTALRAINPPAPG